MAQVSLLVKTVDWLTWTSRNRY